MSGLAQMAFSSAIAWAVRWTAASQSRRPAEVGRIAEEAPSCKGLGLSPGSRPTSRERSSSRRSAASAGRPHWAAARAAARWRPTNPAMRLGPSGRTVGTGAIPPSGGCRRLIASGTWGCSAPAPRGSADRRNPRGSPGWHPCPARSPRGAGASSTCGPRTDDPGDGSDSASSSGGSRSRACGRRGRAAGQGPWCRQAASSCSGRGCPPRRTGWVARPHHRAGRGPGTLRHRFTSFLGRA